MRTHATTTTTGASSGLLRRLWNRVLISGKDREEARERAAALAAGPTVAQRQQQLVEFYGHYEELVEVLCDAAQYGPVEKLEKSYAREREWMHSNYGPVRRYIVAYLKYSVEDAQQSLNVSGAPADAFEALVAAPNLGAFLKADDGCMISRIERTREALTLYGEHLRQLSA